MAQLVAGDTMSDAAMSDAALPPSQTPLYHHALAQLELWLAGLGAHQRGSHSSLWDLHQPQWSALLELEVEELKVSWLQDGQQSVRHFPYGLSRADAEAAILAGP